MSVALSPKSTATVIDTIRTLAMDAVQQANSGHPGTPMALAPVMFTLWSRFLRYDPAHPEWPARDRFILSCGHASMLLYATLHLAGVRSSPNTRHGAEHTGGRGGESSPGLSITLDDIRRFRQLGSPCAGHPEFGDAAGIEMTTGPLGQGVGASVGMAIAAKWKAARFARPGHERLFENRVFVLCSDGDLMEGVGCEAASIAGHLRLDNLCWIYDDNRITIEGETDLAFSEDVARRFSALGWRVQHVDDANDLAALEDALEEFQRETHRPTLIIVRSVIAWGSPGKANTAAAHGSPLGDAEVRRTKEVYGWFHDETFHVPAAEVSQFRELLAERGRQEHGAWGQAFDTYERDYPEQAAEYRALVAGRLPPGWETQIPAFPPGKALATRVASGKVLNAVAQKVPWLLGGSADLAPSTKTLLEFEGMRSFSDRCRDGRNLHFGVREHAMAAIGNGLALCGLRPYVATFFVFCDYLKPALRISAIMHQPVLYVFTHDSIGLGEDGPTHQPIEHLAACRAIPNTWLIRPADANEVAEAYRVAMRQTRRPTLLVLTRQDVPTLDRSTLGPASGLQHGAYILAESQPGVPQVILIGTGSEVHVALAAHERLTSEGIHSRVVSMPSWELFEEQDESYREQVLPSAVARRVVVEAGVIQGWERYLGAEGRFVGMSSFGASAPCEVLYEHFGITAERVYAAAKALLTRIP